MNDPIRPPDPIEMARRRAIIDGLTKPRHGIVAVALIEAALNSRHDAVAKLLPDTTDPDDAIAVAIVATEIAASIIKRTLDDPHAVLDGIRVKYLKADREAS